MTKWVSCLAVCAAAFCSTAKAEFYTLQFTGVVDLVSSDAPASIQVGSPISVAFTYDINQERTYSLGEFGSYLSTYSSWTTPGSQFTMQVGDQLITTPDMHMTVSDNWGDVVSNKPEHLSIRAYGLSVNGTRPQSCGFSGLCHDIPITDLKLETAPGVQHALENHLPWKPLDIADFPVTKGELYSRFTSEYDLPSTKFWRMEYHLTGISMVVPEAGTGALMVLGLAMMVCVSRRVESRARRRRSGPSFGTVQG